MDVSFFPADARAAWTSMAEALLIALIIGVQRETDREEIHAGLRDFLLIGLVGGICGLLHSVELTVTAAVGVVVLLAVFRFQTPGRTGITTELAGLGTFFLALLAAERTLPYSAPLAIGLTILVAFFLEARQFLVGLVRERMTDVEFTDTLRFLAVVLVIYPVLPEGQFGPLSFFEPKRIWLFIILVSSVSYVGYFLQKFLGAGQGLILTAVLGGLASTTATTWAFAKDCREDPANAAAYWHAGVVANSIQFPRLFALLFVANPVLALHTLPALLVMTAAGLLVGWLMSRGAAHAAETAPLKVRNPFQFGAALKFGVIFTAVILVTRLAVERAGTNAVYLAGIAGGFVDLDAVALSLSDLLSAGRTTEGTVLAGVFLAMGSNAVFKTGIAWLAGSAQFGRWLLLAFAAMFSSGLAVLYLMLR